MSDEAELERLLRRVEAGEPLAPDELERLVRIGSTGSGAPLTVRLAAAHALINADDARRALELLRALRRDSRRDVQVPLALARAYASLDQREEARRALEQALALNPDDPEGLKALAALSLQRGELDRARALTARALELDPLDGEAQLLQAELDSGDLPEPASEVEPRPAAGRQHAFSREALASALREELQARAVEHRLQGDSLAVRLRTGAVRFDLTELERRRAREALGDAAAFARRFCDELEAGTYALPASREALLGQLLPVLRDERFLEPGRGAVKQPGPAGLWQFYVLAGSEDLLYLPERALRAYGLSPSEVDAHARRNLAGLPPAPLEPVSLGGCRVWALAAGDGHDAARLMLPEQRARLCSAAGDDRLRLYLGSRDCVLAAPHAEAEALAALSRLSPEADGIVDLFDVTGRESEGEWRRVLAPAP